MTSASRLDPAALGVAIAELQRAGAARKCWSCGCLHATLAAIERGISLDGCPEDLAGALAVARGRLVAATQDCLGCDPCHPALAVNALNDAAGEPLVNPGLCATEELPARPGWPPLPGSYVVLRASGCVAACTLTSSGLADELARTRPDALGIVGTLLTENLGIERLIRNVLANPRIRFLVIAGADSPGRVGHLPGASLACLARHGVDAKSRIVDAPGRRPVLANLTRSEIDAFRSTVEVIDLVGEMDGARVADEIRACGARNPGEAMRTACSTVPSPVTAVAVERMTPDPSGWLVIDPDPRRGILVIEHYTMSGVLDAVIEAASAAVGWSTVIERGLVTRLDHAAYLGQELARAEAALHGGRPYVQDAAPELEGAPSMGSGEAGCGCDPSREPCRGEDT